MKKKCEFLITLLFTMFMTSCQVGLGEIVDLEAPTIRIQKLNSKGQNLISNNGSAFNCAKKVTILGVAEDNVRVDSVYAEIKWGEENSFNYYADAKITDSGSFVLDLNFNREGPVTVKVTAKDSVGNIGSKSSRVVSLYVDETAPVGVSWYIDRKVPGIQIQYNLNSQEILKELDANLSENKDAFQNESFSINSSFQDAMGIKNEMTSIVLKEGSNELVKVKKRERDIERQERKKKYLKPLIFYKFSRLSSIYCNRCCNAEIVFSSLFYKKIYFLQFIVHF